MSRLTLVDLAGSERTKATGASGEAMREAACINKSLSFLEQVVGALARKDAHVPFRCGRDRSLWAALGAGGSVAPPTRVRQPAACVLPPSPLRLLQLTWAGWPVPHCSPLPRARRDGCRQTKLTAVLKDALGGNCATVMVANLWPEAAHLESCVSTLRFASRVRWGR